jgi:hypothetical protein
MPGSAKLGDDNVWLRREVVRGGSLDPDGVSAFRESG